MEVKSDCKIKEHDNPLLLSFEGEDPARNEIDLDEDKQEIISFPFNYIPINETPKNFSNYTCAPLTSENFEQLIINTIKQEDFMNLQAKVYFTYFIIQNQHLLVNLNDFYEEECHLSLLNWVWKEKSLLKNPCFSTEFYSLNFLLELLNNILNIYEILPIKSNDILDLKLFEKLKKIKGYIAKWNIYLPIFDKITSILSKWKNEVDTFTEIKLNQKRKRHNEDDTEADSEDNNLVNFLVFNIEKKNKKKEKKNVKIELNKNKTVYFDKDLEPSSVGKEKATYDPLLLY